MITAAHRLFYYIQYILLQKFTNILIPTLPLKAQSWPSTCYKLTHIFRRDAFPKPRSYQHIPNAIFSLQHAGFSFFLSLIM